MENEEYDTGYGKEENTDLYSKDPVDWEDWDNRDFRKKDFNLELKKLLAIEDQKLPALEGPKDSEANDEEARRREEEDEEKRRQENFSRFEIKSTRTETLDVVNSLPGVSVKLEYKDNPNFFDRLNVSEEGGKRVLRYRGKIIAEHKVGYTRFNTGWYFTMDPNTATMIDFNRQINAAEEGNMGGLRGDYEEAIPNILGELKFTDSNGREIEFGYIKRSNAPLLYEKLKVVEKKESKQLIYNKTAIASRSGKTNNKWEFYSKFEEKPDGRKFLILVLKGKRNYVDTTAYYAEQEAKTALKKGTLRNIEENAQTSTELALVDNKLAIIENIETVRQEAMQVVDEELTSVGAAARDLEIEDLRSEIKKLKDNAVSMEADFEKRRSELEKDFVKRRSELNIKNQAEETEIRKQRVEQKKLQDQYDRDLIAFNERKEKFEGHQINVAQMKEATDLLNEDISKREQSLKMETEVFNRKLAVHDREVKMSETNVNKKLNEIAKKQESLEELEKKLDDKKLFLSEKEEKNSKLIQEKKQLEENIKKEQREKDAKIKEFKTQRRILDQERREKEASLKAMKTEIEDERNKLDESREGLVKAKLELRGEMEDLAQGEETVEELFGWTDELLRKKKNLKASYKSLMSERENLDKQLSDQLKRSEDIQKKLTKEIQNQQQIQSTNTMTFKKQESILEEKISKLKEDNAKSMQEKKEEIEKLREEKNKVIEEKNASENSSNEKIRELESQIRKLGSENNSEKKVLEDKIKKLEEKKKKNYDKYYKELGILEGEITNLTDTKTSLLQKQEELENTISRLESEAKRDNTLASNREIQLKKDIEDEKERYRNLLSEKTHQSDTNIKISNRLETQSEKIDELQSEINILYEELNTKGKQVSDRDIKLNSELEKTKNLQSKLDNERKVVEQKQQELNILSQKIMEKEFELNDTKEKKTELENLNNQLRQKQSELSDANNKLSVKQQQFDTENMKLKKDIGKLKETGIKGQVDIIVKKAQISELVREYEEVRLKLEEQKAKLSEKDLDNDNLTLKINKLESELTLEKLYGAIDKNDIQDREEKIITLKKELNQGKVLLRKEVLRSFEQENALYEKGQKIIELEEREKMHADPIPDKDWGEYKGIRKTYENTKKMARDPDVSDKYEKVVGQIKYLEKQLQRFKDQEKATDNPINKKIYEMFIERCEFEIDRIRMDFLNKAPQSQKMIDALVEETRNNPEVAFEKFKRFVKENFIGISGALIGIAGIITSIAVGIRSAAKTAGGTARKTGSDMSAKGGLQGLLGQFIKNLGKIISWSGDNIFLTIGILVVVVIVIKRR